METKVCIQCGEEKTLDRFYKNRRKCKDCLNEKRRNKHTVKKDNEIKEVKEVEQTNNLSSSFIESNLSILLKTGFGLIATRAGEHWNISDSESTSIAKPVSNLLSKLKYVEKIAENIDIIQLTIALSAVVVPRTMVTIANKKGDNDNGTIKPAKESTNIQEDSRENEYEKENNTADNNIVEGNTDRELELYNEAVNQELL